MEQADFVAAAARPNTSSRLNHAMSSSDFVHQLSMLGCRAPTHSRYQTKSMDDNQWSPALPASVTDMSEKCGRYEILSRVDANGHLPKQCDYPYSVNMNWTFDLKNILHLTCNSDDIEYPRGSSSNGIQVAHNPIVGDYRYLQSQVFKTEHPESEWRLRVVVQMQHDGESWLVGRLLADRLTGSLAEGVLGQCSFQYTYGYTTPNVSKSSAANNHAVLHGIWCESDQDGVFLVPLRNIPSCCVELRISANLQFGRLDLNELLGDFESLSWQEDICPEVKQDVVLPSKVDKQRFWKKVEPIARLVRCKRSSLEIIWLVQNFSSVVGTLGRNESNVFLASPFFGDSKEAFIFQIFLLPRGRQCFMETLQVELHLLLAPRLLRSRQRGEFVQRFPLLYSTCVNGQYQQSNVTLLEGDSHGCTFPMQHLFSQQTELKIKLKITFELPL